MNWTIQRSKPKQNVFYLDFHGYGAEWKKTVYLGSDWHWDNRKCDRELLKKHLDKALALNAPIVVTGDILDLMQGKKDPRKSMSALRPEHIGEDYFDLIAETFLDFIEPYAHLVALFTYGNHETSNISHHEHDVLATVYHRMKDRFKSPVLMGGYGAYIVCRMIDPGQKTRGTYTIRTIHGSGGGGPVTKGVIGTNRRGVYIVDADLIQSGHVHEGWIVTQMQERILKGAVFAKTTTHLTTPTYKQEFGLNPGYHVIAGRPPKPLGCAWLEFVANRSGNTFFDSSVRLDLKTKFEVH